MHRNIRSCLTGLILLCLSLVVGQADAQTDPSPPAGMTQQQYNELVKSVGVSVLQTLTEKGLVAQPSERRTPSATCYFLRGPLLPEFPLRLLGITRKCPAARQGWSTTIPIQGDRP